MNDIDDKLETLLNELIVDKLLECTKLGVQMDDLDECKGKIKALFRHGVCADCKIYDICESRNRFPLKYTVARDDFCPDKSYCSEFDPKEKA